MIATIAAWLVLAAVPVAPAPARSPAAPGILTIDDALATARARQPQIVQAAAATQLALARADQALSALRPQVLGNARYQRATTNVASPGGESWQTSGYLNLGASASVLVTDFGQSSNAWKASKAGASSQRESERTTLQQVLFSVRTAYSQAQAAKGLVGVAQDTLANQQKHLNQTEGFVEVGTQAPIALAQAKTGVANARVQLITAENSLASAKAQLNLAMGVDQPADYDVTDEPLSPTAGEDKSTEELLEEAVAARPEIAALREQVRAEELALRAQNANYAPSLSASTGLADAGVQVGSLTWNWDVALTMSIPIFLGGQQKAQVHEARASLAIGRAQLDQAMQQVRLDVEQARLAVRAAKEALAASLDARENAQEQLSLAEGRYETGAGSIIELGDAQVASTSAGQQKVVADYALAQARAQLLKALGRE